MLNTQDPPRLDAQDQEQRSVVALKPRFLRRANHDRTTSRSILERLRSHRLRCWQYYMEGGRYAQKAASELPISDQAVLNQLKRQGGAQTSLNRLNLPMNESFIRAAQALSAQLPTAPEASNSHLGHCIHGDAATIVNDYPEIFLWGLQDRLLDIVENYVQLPVSYLGVDLRKDIPNGKQVGTRFWHTDGEDTCVVKIAVYLSDVEQEHGPFEYISKTQFNAARRYFSPTYLRKNFRQRLIDDQLMGSIVAPHRWTSCTGPAETTVFVDTTHVLHHGAVPIKERTALFFAYATRTPKNLAFCKNYFPVEHLLPRFEERVSKRQWDCLWAWRQMNVDQHAAPAALSQN